MGWLKQILRLLKTFYIIFSIALVLFIVINIGAALYFKIEQMGRAEGIFFIGKNSDEGIEIRKQIFNTNDEALLKQYAEPPGIRPHTVLHFTEGASREHYTVGIEGIRYLPNWTDNTVRDILAQKDNVTFVFGGSTTFGDGVPNDSTVVAYLDILDKENTYVNFGVQAYDSIREVDKLLYLLRKGYRPHTVIFIDGLNDVATFASSPYEIHDTPRAQGLVLDRGEVPLIFGTPSRENMFLAFLYSLPVTHVIHRFRNKNDYAEGVFNRKSANIHGLSDWREVMDFYYYWATIHRNKIDQLATDIIRYYEENMSFVRQLGEAFGFSAHFIYQPIGLLENNHPFLSRRYFQSSYFAIYKEVDLRIREAIEKRDLIMEDCSRAISESGVGASYVDATHYSPRGNKTLAQCIQQKVSDTNQL